MCFILILSSFWFLREIKATLFWLYLWQLKEYHIGRFVDHFRTYKGKKLFINELLFLKVILVLLFFLQVYDGSLYLNSCSTFGVFSWILLILYFFESAKGLYSFFQNKLKMPVFTKKVILLFLSSLVFLSFYFLILFSEKNYFVIFLLIFDILTPFIISGIVLLLQPLTVLLRSQIIRKARIKRKRLKKLQVIGITGSYGKTSTKNFLAKILSQKFKTLSTKANQNSEVGIARCVLNELNESHEIFIVEMGAYNRGGIKLLCDITQPEIGILTGINEQHIALFGSFDDIIKAKYELIESLPKEGLAIFNGSNEHCQRLYQNTSIKKKITKKNVWAENIKVEKDYITFNVFTGDGDSANFRLNLLGAQNVENILLAACCAKELGMNLAEISKACKNIQQEKGTARLIRTKENLNIIDSTYSANPNSVSAHLDYLKIWRGKKVIVMPCLIELGGASFQAHYKIGQKIASVCDLAIITTKECFSTMRKGALEVGMSEKNILFLDKPKLIFDKIKKFSQKEDIILLEGRMPKGFLKRFYGG